LAGLGKSSLDFEIRAFVASYDLRLRVKHDTCATIERRLHVKGIEIPFQQRELHVCTAPGPRPSDSAGDNGSAGPRRHPA
jgi:potassium efflux system protein